MTLKTILVMNVKINKRSPTMPSDREIEAARKAIAFMWQETGGMVGQYLDCEGLAKAALEAAEQERQDMHSELVEALESIANGFDGYSPEDWKDIVLEIREVAKAALNKATKEG